MDKLIDTSTDYGRRVAYRLKRDLIIWLTTVNDSGEPNPRPVWFLWDGRSFLVYSRSDTYKLTHIRNNSRVALNLDGDGEGGDIVVILGEAVADESAPSADKNLEYVNKYAAGLERIGLKKEEFAEIYSTAIRITPLRIRGH